MKKRIAYVSYNNCELNQFKIKSRLNSTEVLYGDGHSPNFKNTVAARVTELLDEETGGLLVEVPGPNGEVDKIKLTACEVEYVLTALLAHQRLVEGYDLQLYKKD